MYHILISHKTLYYRNSHIIKNISNSNQRYKTALLGPQSLA
ncbi:hypothetical protein HMPREF1548_06641 [Clostridium sp. KLE 1755]|nr:hypothetical protein HMPREF1548_06641 [Clostridium sp. KLE 1755]